MTKQSILASIENLIDEGKHLSYDQWPGSEPGKHGQYHAFVGWMGQVIDVGRHIKQKVGSSSVLGMANGAHGDFRASQPTVDKDTFESVHGRLSEALKVAHNQVSSLWPDEVDTRPGDEQFNVLLIWSKEQSEAVASILHEWLPRVVPGIKPWMSTEDIAKGLDWFVELHDVLVKSRICIICVTPENVRSPWLYYETGAIATNGPDVLIYPYLLGVAPSMLADGPLGRRQWTVADRDDTWKLIKSLNKYALDSKHDPALLEGNFQSRWPDFYELLERISQIETEDSEGFIATDADQLAGINLSSEARIMVLEVSKSSDGTLAYLEYRGIPPDTEFQVNGKNICPDKSIRTVAKWKRALDDLVEQGILEDVNYKGIVYKITDKGFTVADALQSQT